MFVQGARVKASANILDVGFGTGLNFLSTVNKYQVSPMHYVGLDHTLPTARYIEDLGHANQLGLPALGKAFLEWRKALPDEVPFGSYKFEYEGIKLRLHIGDATQAVLPPNNFNAVYLDPFSPSVNPELWTASFLKICFRSTAPGGYLATYSAAGKVRRAMKQAGYIVSSEPGPPGKREMTVGLKPIIP